MIYICKGCEWLVSAPCQALAWLCSSCSSLLDKCCGDLHRCCDKPCSGFAIMTVVLAGAGMVCFVITAAQPHESVPAIMLAVFCAVHILFAFYLQWRLSRGMAGSDPAAPAWNSKPQREMLQDMRNIILYDIGFCLYVLFFVGNVVYVARAPEDEGNPAPELFETGLFCLGLQLGLTVVFASMWWCFTSFGACCEVCNRMFVPASRPEQQVQLGQVNQHAPHQQQQQPLWQQQQPGAQQQQQQQQQPLWHQQQPGALPVVTTYPVVQPVLPPTQQQFVMPPAPPAPSAPPAPPPQQQGVLGRIAGLFNRA